MTTTVAAAPLMPRGRRMESTNNGWQGNPTVGSCGNGFKYDFHESHENPVDGFLHFMEIDGLSYEIWGIPCSDGPN